MPKVIALIPARGGSKGLPRKNALFMNGKPMLAWSISAASKSSYINDIYVTTEDAEISDLAVKSHVEVIDRPNNLALDETSMDDVLLHAILTLQVTEDFVCVLLQPTSPLRTAAHIDEAVSMLLRDPNATGVISTCLGESKVLKSYVLGDDNRLVTIYKEDAPFMSRQTLPEVYMPNGAIYCFWRSKFMKNKCIPRQGMLNYCMEPEDSIDVDLLADFKLVEERLKNRE